MPRLVRYAVVLDLQGDRWLGRFLEFPHLQASGDEQDKVITKLADLLQAEVSSIKGAGRQLPPPLTRVAYIGALERGVYDIFPC